MNYVIYKLDFQSSVHFGQNDLSKSANSFMADTLFSALCLEAVKMGNDCLESLCDIVRDGRLKFSDALPFIKDTYYLPKPVKKIENDRTGDSVVKKAFKKLEYIPADKMSDYLQGKLEPESEERLLNEGLGDYGMKVSVVIKGMEEPQPYHIRYFSFKKESGLYVIMAYADDEARGLFEDLMMSLSYSGIGGRRSAGFGRFEFRIAKMPEYILSRLTNDAKEYMSLSVSLPQEGEMEAALENAGYVLIKRSGFVESDTYADTFKRKKDIFVMKAGSCFKKMYKGSIYDVSGDGSHSVYKYAIPLWMGVSE
ncbi:MAG: type III-A CRISPR-associated RAMP protein Csm4 [Lachnospiraceae bacterium]|nr:type III-A CRISPR-associated RAMP protein Csm4 [Lachnospiraceae bacterium]